ncbi:hypothetical protein WJX77_007129 [Trebouxia sp. C0004]
MHVSPHPLIPSSLLNSGQPRIVQSFLNCGLKHAITTSSAELDPASAEAIKSLSCIFLKTAAKGIIGWRLDLYSACLIVLQTSLTLQASPHQGE